MNQHEQHAVMHDGIASAWPPALGCRRPCSSCEGKSHINMQRIKMPREDLTAFEWLCDWRISTRAVQHSSSRGVIACRTLCARKRIPPSSSIRVQQGEACSNRFIPLWDKRAVPYFFKKDLAPICSYVCLNGQIGTHDTVWIRVYSTYATDVTPFYSRIGFFSKR